MLGKWSKGSLSCCGSRGCVVASVAMLLAAGLTSCASGPEKKPAEGAETEAKSMQLESWSGTSAKAAADSDEARRGQFDSQQAEVVLARAAKNAHQCVDIVTGKDQPHGEAKVTVTFSPKGYTTKADVSEPFAGTPMGECASRAFQKIVFPPFEGGDVQRVQTVDLNPTPKAEKGEGGKKKAKGGE